MKTKKTYTKNLKNRKTENVELQKINPEDTRSKQYIWNENSYYKMREENSIIKEVIEKYPVLKKRVFMEFS